MNLEKAKTIGYWVTTSLVALDFVAGGVFNLTGAPQVTAAMTHLGYPAYFTAMLGVWKILGGAAILAPRFPRLKEWAYAGIVFDVTSASVSTAASGDGLGPASFPLAFGLLVLASWALRPASRRLGTIGARATSPASHAALPTTLEAA